MKRLISFLVVVAMLLASVLAMFPVSADDVVEEVTPGTPVATYNVNWKKLVNRGVMKGQWCFAASETYNNFENFYNITATDTAFETSYKGTGVERQYYSTQMFDITADTHYEYVFEVKNNPDRPTGTAGVIFAFAINKDLYVETGDFKDFTGTAQAPYWLNGEFGLDSDRGDGKGFELSVNCAWQADKNSGYVLGYKKDVSAGCSTETGIGMPKLDADGYATYKVVYNGLDVSFFYLDANDAWVEFFVGQESTLAEGSKVTFGVYNRDNRMAFLRNCKLYAMDEATALIMAKNAATFSIAAGDKEIAKGGYTTTTTAALTTALEAAKALVADETATAATLAEATANVETAIDGLLVGAVKTALSAKIAEAEAALSEDKFADKAELWAAYAEKLAAAKALVENVDALQPETDAMLAELRAAIVALIGADKTALDAKIAEVQAIEFDKYYPISWAPVAKAFVEAKKLNDSDVAFQADIDAALAALEAALPGVKEKPAVKVYDYTVNWALFLEYGILRSQWWNDAAEGQNIYLNKYTVEATANSLSSTAKGDGDNHTYYSRVMYEITENTYYEYTFKAKNNAPTGSVGVMFAYDTAATNTHFIYGYFDNASGGGAGNFRVRAGHHGYPDRNPPSHDANNDPQYYPVLNMTEDGYGQFKFVYDGFTFTFHYLNADGRYEQVGEAITLPATAKICPGVYTKGKNTVSIKDAVLSAFSAEDALRIAITDATYATKIGSAEAATGKYTPETTKALTDAIAAVEAEIAKAAEADPATIVALTAPVLAATKALVNKKALDAKIAEIDAEALVQGDWTTATWTVFAAALEAAKAESANTETTQANVDKALKALTDARKALDPAAEGDKTALNAKIEAAKAVLKAEDFTAEDKVALWEAYATALANAEKVSADKSEFGNQTATDAALKALVDAINKLIAADKSALKTAINNAKELVEGKYEPQGWPEFVAALAAAEAVYADDLAFQADIDAAIANLDTAIAALTRKPLAVKATYNVNWKYMYENKLMKAQWWNETWQNDFEDHFTVNATEEMLNVVSKKKNDEDGNLGDTRAYYGTNMYKITATTYYEYTFKVKHDSVRSTYAGVIFAYDTTSNPDNQLAYIFYGGLANLSDEGECSYITIQYGHQDGSSDNKDKPGPCVDRIAGPVMNLVVGTDEDGFATYKIVYDGYWASFFYIDPTTGEFTEMPVLRVKLKETAAVCFGTYTRENRDNTVVADPRTVTQKNGVLVAMNDEAAGYMLVNKADLSAKIAEVKAMNENEYTTATWAILTEALAAAEAMVADANAFQVMVDNALAALNSAVSKLGKPGDATVLKEKLAAAELLKKEDYNCGTMAWNMFQKAITDGKATAESRDSTQGDIDMAIALLDEAIATLGPKVEPVTPPTETETQGTEKPTDAATEAPTDKATDDNAGEPAEEGCGGCGSSAAISAIAIVSIIGTAVALKKKED